MNNAVNPIEQIEIEREKEAHPYLITDESLSSFERAQKNIFILLKRDFPDTCFCIMTVVSSNNDISTEVYWEGFDDAPTIEEIHPIVSLFQGGNVNTGKDKAPYEYATSGLRFREVFGGISSLRSRIRPPTLAQLASRAASKLSDGLPPSQVRSRRTRF